MAKPIGAANLQNGLTRRNVLSAGAGLWILSRAGLAAEPSSAVREVAQGKLRGALQASVLCFKGVPYGAPTGGPNRFLPPQPMVPWKGERSALLYGHPCPQHNTDFSAWVDNHPAGEDCLSLNIWAPQANSSTPRAVMVWIHGGGYFSGSGGLPIYDGHNLALKGDVVVVTVNHRLDIFGYLHLAGGADSRFAQSTNLGQLDLIASLRWVRENIAVFGGDPNNVTIFGESGGGGKVSALLAMPAAHGLFHKAIVESGSSLSVMSAEEANDVAKLVYVHLGIPEGNVDALQRIPTATLLQCYEKLTEGWSPGERARVQFAPCIDGHAIPQQTWTPAAPAFAAEIPMLIGCNSHESVAFIDKQMYQPIPDDKALVALIMRYSWSRGLDEDRTTDLLALYRREMPALSRLELLVRITTDTGMWHNAVAQATRKQQLGGASVYMYEFGWRTPCFGGGWALHGIEIPFVFGNLDYGVAWDGKDSTALRAAADPNGDRFALAERSMEIWSRFARTGEPSAPGLPAWPSFTPDKPATMVLDRQCSVVEDLRAPVRSTIMAL